MYVVDSHCHLDFPDFDEDRDAMIERARAEGVRTMLTISTRPSKFGRLRELAERYPDVYATIGTHPLSAAEEPEMGADEYLRIAAEPKVVGIGEAGLDYFHDRAPRDVQERVFRRQIGAARTTGLPLVIHARECDADMIHILTEESGQGPFRFVLHCFASGEELALRGLELGGTVSFSGILAFKRSDELRAIARQVPLDRLLVETDAPYLAPPPDRGKRNEPSYVVRTLEALAAAKDLPVREMARITTDNFFRLFSKVPDPRGAA
ncbi:TatD family hydrolase [Aureimonas leprariae]|uniref:TatD family deoxyribonuclease n=1 Tax=Plantimonas leprariae TaxID=2615207 RepID=A0A7V7PRS4_9HYPH|nr:TatD family hydrolase [Aureimonas leprariae]KAB0681754.1 TatD family deoxyribonuclease [Aureimonas leprariae]